MQQYNLDFVKSSSSLQRISARYPTDWWLLKWVISPIWLWTNLLQSLLGHAHMLLRAQVRHSPALTTSNNYSKHNYISGDVQTLIYHKFVLPLRSERFLVISHLSTQILSGGQLCFRSEWQILKIIHGFLCYRQILPPSAFFICG